MDFYNHANTSDTICITNTVERICPFEELQFNFNTKKTCEAVKMVFVGGLMGPCFVMAESNNYTVRKKIIFVCHLPLTMNLLA